MKQIKKMKEIKKLRKIIPEIILAVIVTILIINRWGNECTVPYLNPWQHLFRCSLFHGFYYLFIFIVSLLIIYQVINKVKKLR
jgi:hypothetical protein